VTRLLAESGSLLWRRLADFRSQPSGNTDGQYDTFCVISRCELERACRERN